MVNSAIPGLVHDFGTGAFQFTQYFGFKVAADETNYFITMEDAVAWRGVGDPYIVFHYVWGTEHFSVESENTGTCNELRDPTNTWMEYLVVLQHFSQEKYTVRSVYTRPHEHLHPTLFDNGALEGTLEQELCVTVGGKTERPVFSAPYKISYDGSGKYVMTDPPYTFSVFVDTETEETDLLKHDYDVYGLVLVSAQLGFLIDGDSLSVRVELTDEDGVVEPKDLVKDTDYSIEEKTGSRILFKISNYWFNLGKQKSKTFTKIVFRVGFDGLNAGVRREAGGVQSVVAVADFHSTGKLDDSISPDSFPDGMGCLSSAVGVFVLCLTVLFL